jgi:hypothetical protein
MLTTRRDSLAAPGHSFINNSPCFQHTNSKSHTPIFVLGDSSAHYSVPPCRIIRAPVNLLPIESLVLCPAFDPAFPSLTHCPLGTACRHVHADVTGLPLIEVHVNYAWSCLADVAYPRHEPGELVDVAPPNSREAIDTIDTGFLLRTRALDSTVRRCPLTHCAHYYYNRECNFGCECRFVHAVFLDPSVVSRMRRAPAPVQLGRGHPPVTTGGLDSVLESSVTLSPTHGAHQRSIFTHTPESRFRQSTEANSNPPASTCVNSPRRRRRPHGGDVTDDGGELEAPHDDTEHRHLWHHEPYLLSAANGSSSRGAGGLYPTTTSVLAANG